MSVLATCQILAILHVGAVCLYCNMKIMNRIFNPNPLLWLRNGFSHQAFKRLYNLLRVRSLVCSTSYWSGSPLLCTETQCTSPELSRQLHHCWFILAVSALMREISSWFMRNTKRSPAIWGGKKKKEKKACIQITQNSKISIDIKQHGIVCNYTICHFHNTQTNPIKWFWTEFCTVWTGHRDASLCPLSWSVF